MQLNALCYIGWDEFRPCSSGRRHDAERDRPVAEEIALRGDRPSAVMLTLLQTLNAEF